MMKKKRVVRIKGEDLRMTRDRGDVVFSVFRF